MVGWQPQFTVFGDTVNTASWVESTGEAGRPQPGSYLRLIDSCITQLKAQGPSRTCNESKEEEGALTPTPEHAAAIHGVRRHSQHRLARREHWRAVAIYLSSAPGLSIYHKLSIYLYIVYVCMYANPHGMDR